MTQDIGSPAPDFQAPATGGKTLSLADFADRVLVLYFYPRDNTPGCTQEGEAFRDLYPRFQAAGAEIVGVSRDSLRKHDNFRAQYGFPFDLLCDADETMCRAYGVLREKHMYGRRHIGIERSTFVIDASATIRHAWRGVKVAEHARQVLECVRALANGARARDSG